MNHSILDMPGTKMGYCIDRETVTGCAVVPGERGAAPGTRETDALCPQVAHDGLAQAIRPCHTRADGDALFALSLSEDQERRMDVVRLGALAAAVMAEAIVRAGIKASTPGDTLAVRDVRN